MKNLVLILGLFVAVICCKSKDTENTVSSGDSLSVDTLPQNNPVDSSETLTTIPDDSVQMKADTIKATR